jgi:hypothetical protein
MEKDNLFKSTMHTQDANQKIPPLPRQQPLEIGPDRDDPRTKPPFSSRKEHKQTMFEHKARTAAENSLRVTTDTAVWSRPQPALPQDTEPTPSMVHALDEHSEFVTQSDASSYGLQSKDNYRSMLAPDCPRPKPASAETATLPVSVLRTGIL